MEREKIRVLTVILTVEIRIRDSWSSSTVGDAAKTDDCDSNKRHDCKDLREC
jgi:hypothetical protein